MGAIVVGWTDGWMGEKACRLAAGWMDGYMAGWMNECMDEIVSLASRNQPHVNNQTFVQHRRSTLFEWYLPLKQGSDKIRFSRFLVFLHQLPAVQISFRIEL